MSVSLSQNSANGADQSTSEQPAFPKWFVNARALADGRYGSVEHDGCTIAYQIWGKPGSEPMLMLHGAGASSEWWEATAILLADRFHIVAPSFAGVGRSQWREAYTIEQCVAEAMACARAEGVLGADVRPICVAHSFGSEVGVRLAIDPGEVISQLIMVDSLIGLYGSSGANFPLRERQFYASAGDAVQRYATVPRDDFGPAFLRAHVARQSLESVTLPSGDAAWTWRADPNVMAKLAHETAFDRLGDAICSVDFIFGGLSSMNSAELRQRQAEVLNRGAVFLGIDDAGHHIPLDRPAELADAIHKLVALRQT